MIIFPAQVYRVHYRGPTDRRGARMAAVDGFGKRKTVKYDSELSDYQNAREAAVACSYAAGWGRPIEMVGASFQGGWIFIATGWESGVVE